MQKPSAGDITADANQSMSRSGLPLRIWILAGVLALECLSIAQIPHEWLSVQQLMAAPIVFGAALLFFGRDRLRSVPPENSSLSRPWAGVHVLSLALAATCAVTLLRSRPLTPASIHLLEFGWFFFVALTAVSLALVLFAPRILASIGSRLGAAWSYALLTALAAMVARGLARYFWDAPQSSLGHGLQQATFYGVRAILAAFYPVVISNSSAALLGTDKFIVQIAGACSGIEGLALMLALTVGWLTIARRELRLTRAIWLIPVSLAAIWLLNLLRITALIALGDSGHRGIAVNGFHSEAGWIFFNAVAIAFLIAAQNIQALRRAATAETAAARPSEAHFAEACLIPFLAIVAVSFLTRAVSSGFESLYPIRFFVALGCLWYFRAEYRKVNWRFGWLGPVAGVVVFAIWIALAHLTLGPTATAAGDKMLVGLGSMSHWHRLGWIGIRVLAGVITVPVAEELAFRGYLARRVMAHDVAQVPLRQLTVGAIVWSSFAFGLLHGNMMIAGVLAGAVFALVAKTRNRLGEAVAAHATANLLLAVWVLMRGDYRLW